MNKDLLKNAVGNKPSKHMYEFQEICTELEPIYGKIIWNLPYKVGVTEHKIKEAHEISKKRGITTYPYLLGILRKL